MNFFRTLAIFRRNPFVNPRHAMMRHIAWQIRKGLNRFPCVLRVDDLRVEIRNKAIANGCGALLNAMGFYDPNNMYFLREVFDAGVFHVFFDIGANIGIYALIAGSAPGAVVYAFEPHPVTYQLLQANITLNQLATRVEAVAAALADQNGVVQFDDIPGSPVNRLVVDSAEGRPVVAVQVMRGDDFCQQRNLQPDVLKIDVEGYELPVLAGFSATLPMTQLILVETAHPQGPVASLLAEHGFSGPYKIDYRQRKLRTIFESYEDWVFVHRRALPPLAKLGFHVAA